MVSDFFAPHLQNGLDFFDHFFEQIMLESNRLTVGIFVGLFLLILIVIFVVKKLKPEAGKKIGSKMMAVKDFVAPGKCLNLGKSGVKYTERETDKDRQTDRQTDRQREAGKKIGSKMMAVKDFVAPGKRSKSGKEWRKMHRKRKGER